MTINQQKYVVEIEMSIKEHEKDMIEINEAKSEASRLLNDEELHLLWSLYMEELEVSPYLRPYDISGREYALIMGKIFGIKSRDVFLKRTKDSVSWNNRMVVSSRRIANDIVMTYRRRGYNFLCRTLVPKQMSDFEVRYLDPHCYGFLNEVGRKKAIEIKKRLAETGVGQ